RLAFILLIVLPFASQALAQKKKDVLPTPTGDHSIGRTTFYWKDESREEPATADPEDKRELRVDLWYPAEENTTAAKAPYCPDLDRIKSQLGLTAAAHGNIETHTLVDPAVLLSGAPFPVLLFSPGLGNLGIHYTALVEEWVSHGYAVATVDHPFQSG